MKRHALKDYLSMPGNTQAALAKAVGVTQGAINQMLRSERLIYVLEHDDASIALEEVRRLGRAGAAA